MTPITRLVYRSGALGLIWLPCVAAAQTNGLDAARAHREGRGAAILRDFAELLAIPNVASDSVGIRRNARFVRGALARRGVAMEQWTLPGAPPLLYGEITVPGATRTLGLYVHYDGQPVDSSDWVNPPWTPTLYTRRMEDGGVARPLPELGEPVDPEWRLYARSAGDDKAPLGGLFAVLDAFQRSGVSPTSNIKFVFDGEEEAGSRHLQVYLRDHRDRVDDIDIWLFLDGPVHPSRLPQLTFGVRGGSSMRITVYGANRPLHTGHYGNWAPVPGQLLAHLLASMKAEDGTVPIEGFYDTVEPIGPTERAALSTVPDFDEALRRELGIGRTEGGGAPLAERILLPSLTIRSLESGGVGNVIPTEASAFLNIRLVKGNDPEGMLDVVEAHIRTQGYHIVRDDPDLATRVRHPKIARVERRAGYPAARTSMELPLVQQVIEAARRAAGEQPLVLLPTMGGSLPLYLFTDLLDRPAINVPIANHDNNQHAENENLRVANLWYGIDLLASLLTMPDDGLTP